MGKSKTTNHGELVRQLPCRPFLAASRGLRGLQRCSIPGHHQIWNHAPQRNGPKLVRRIAPLPTSRFGTLERGSFPQQQFQAYCSVMPQNLPDR